MKNLVIIVLLIMAIYWLFDHHAPLPLNHDSLGLYNHTIHKIIGAVCAVAAVFFIWLWKFRPQA